MCVCERMGYRVEVCLKMCVCVRVSWAVGKWICMETFLELVHVQV